MSQIILKDALNTRWLHDGYAPTLKQYFDTADVKDVYDLGECRCSIDCSKLIRTLIDKGFKFINSEDPRSNYILEHNSNIVKIPDEGDDTVIPIRILKDPANPDATFIEDDFDSTASLKNLLKYLSTNKQEKPWYIICKWHLEKDKLGPIRCNKIVAGLATLIMFRTDLDIYLNDMTYPVASMIRDLWLPNRESHDKYWIVSGNAMYPVECIYTESGQKRFDFLEYGPLSEEELIKHYEILAIPYEIGTTKLNFNLSEYRNIMVGLQEHLDKKVVKIRKKGISDYINLKGEV